MYSESMAALTNSDVNAAQDDVLTRRNSHLIFTQPLNLLAAWGSSSTLTRARFANASLIRLGNVHLWPLERSDTVIALPQMMDFRDAPMKLPQNEELTIEATTDAAGPIIQNFLLLLSDPRWSPTFPAFQERLKTRATAVITAGAASSWTALSEITFERDLWNGVYAVVGANVVAANAIAFRFRFPDQRPAYDRQFRPGGLVQNALGLDPNPMFSGGLGEWGRFHTFTPPEVQLFDDTAGGTYEIRLDLLYLGEAVGHLGA